MDVNELGRLADWYIDHFSTLNQLYSNLISPIQHNASQPNKQPVEGHLEELLAYLEDVSFEELSLQQLKLLNELGVDIYLGREGSAFVEGVIRTSEYDPATAAERLGEAVARLNETNAGFIQYRKSLKTLLLAPDDETEEADTIIIRVGFQNEASIKNLTDWKDSAKDWYDIIRGLALAADEAPEDTKIIGASNGSIILTLAGTLTITTLLALISKNIASVAKEVIGIGNQIEDLRAKKWLNVAIERELRKKEESTKGVALRDIVKLIKKRMPDLDGEKVTALEGSIKKLLSFNEKGGNLDFVAPQGVAEDGDDTDGNEENFNPLKEVQTMIREYQAERDQLKLLTDQTEAERAKP